MQRLRLLIVSHVAGERPDNTYSRHAPTDTGDLSTWVQLPGFHRSSRRLTPGPAGSCPIFCFNHHRTGGACVHVNVRGSHEN